MEILSVSQFTHTHTHRVSHGVVFVCFQLVRLEKGEKKETIFDQVFNGALKEFQHNLLTQVSVTQQV